MSKKTGLGEIISLRRYPVKSMGGEALSVAHVGGNGFLGDRAYALIDASDGKIATAKNPRKWPTLFSFQASLMETSGSSEKVSTVCIKMQDGTTVTSYQRDIDQILSQILNRDVVLALVQDAKVTGVQSPLPDSWSAKSEEYWPDIDGRDKQNTVTDFALPVGTFFDFGQIHLLTTSTLVRLGDSYPQGSFETQRFRPNIVVETLGSEKSFVEEAWIGQTLAIGDEVRLKITGSCGRCVMTTLAQGDLPKDIEILRTVVQQNQGNVGVYASVVQTGLIRAGDRVRLES